MKKKPLKLKDIHVLNQIYDPHTDSYLVTGTLKNPAARKPYILGFRKRHGRTLLDEKTYSNKGWLTRSFRDALQNNQWPNEKTFKTDTHAKRLYAWENTYLVPHAPNVSEKTARQIIRQVCEDYGMAPIKLRWRKEGGASWYFPSDNSITFHHRDLVLLLHEIGHAIHDQDDRSKKGAHHAPAFARILLELYNRYAGFPIDYLIVSANKHGILGDLNAKQIIFDPTTHRPRIHIPHSKPRQNP